MKALLSALFLSVPGLQPFGGGASQGQTETGLIITPSITVTETYTDDVDLDETIAQSDFVTMTTLGLVVSNNGPRNLTNLNYGLTHLFYPGLDGDQDEFRHNLQANSNTEILRDLFFFDAAAGVNQQFVDRRGAFTSVEVARTDNRATVSIIDVEPYLLHRVGGNFATLRTGYNYSYIDSSNNITFDGIDLGDSRSQFHQASMVLASGARFTKFTWDWQSFYQHQVRNNQGDLDVYETAFTTDYQITRKVAAIGSIGYNKRVGDGNFNDFNGVIWRVGGRLTPGPRTVIEASYGKDFFGNTWDVSASYQITENMIFNASYSDEYQTFAEAALDDFQDGGADGGIDQNLITQEFARFKDYVASITGVRGRSTITVSVSRRETTSDNPIADFDRNTVGIVWQRQLSPRLTFIASGNFMEDTFAATTESDIFVNFEGRFDYLLSTNLTASIEYIHTQREQELFNYVPRKSNYVSVILGYTF